MRAWVEIDIKNLLFNIDKIRNLAKDKEIIAVVKANCYGLGAKHITKIMQENGINNFAVATLNEALELFDAGIENILILGALLNDEIDIAYEKNFTITLANIHQLEYIEKNKLDIAFHVKVDTGMGRLGFDTLKAQEIIDYSLGKKLNIQGIYSHLSDSDGMNDEADIYTINQIKKFEVFRKYSDKVKFIHLLNSGGILRFNEGFVGNAVRPGICMYGMVAGDKIPGFARTFEVKTKVLSISTAKEEKLISYGRKGNISKDETYATLGMGYADGIKKILSQNSYAIIKGVKCQFVGEICMDMCMVRIPDSIKNEISLGEEAIILRDDIIEESTGLYKCACDTLTGIGNRVVRVYKEK